MLQKFCVINHIFVLFCHDMFCRLIGVCGPVGSGKSSLISIITGQLKIDSGSLSLNGSLAYVPQQAWIFNDTAKENILFGSSLDEEKYNQG